MASYPTYKPSVYVGRIDPEKLAPLVNDAAAKAANFPGLNRVTQVAYPPGSTWKPVTALAAMQEHLLSPYSSIQCTPTAEYGARQAGLQELGPVRQPADEPAGGARDVVRHLLLRRRQPVLRGRRGGAQPPAAVGSEVRLRRADRPRHRQRGAVVADDRADARLAQEDVQDATGTRPGTPATRSSSRSARRTSP